MSMRARLIMLVCMSSLLPAMVVYSIGQIVIRVEFDELMDVALYEEATKISAALDDLAEFPGGATAINLGITRYQKKASGVYWQVTDDHAQIVFAKSPSLTELEMLVPARESLSGTFTTSIKALEQEVRVLPASYQHGDKSLILFVAMDTGLLTSTKTQMTSILLLALSGIVVIGALVSSFFARLVFAPIKEFERSIELVLEGQNIVLSEQHPNELVPATKTINSLLKTIEQQKIRARMLAANLAHTVKNSVTSLRDLAEGETLVDAVQIMQIGEKIHEHTSLHLSRARSAAGLPISPSELGECIRDIVVVLGPQATMNNKVIRFDCPDNMSVMVDKADLYDILGNLLDNSLRHAVREVDVVVTLESNFAVLCISDDGPGFDDEQLNALELEDGRIDSGVESSGLGLSLAKGLAESYGCSILIKNCNSGGALFRVALPCALG